MSLPLEGTPYLATREVEHAIESRLSELQKRVDRLRGDGVLSSSALQRYYGQKRFEQVAESNAIEGSTLTVRETELAITKGITIDEHSPKYIADARALDKAHERLVELASADRIIDNSVVNELHSLLLAGHGGSGMFRSSSVRITGAKHTPPKTREQVTSQMASWQEWSRQHQDTSAPIRSAILHAWLTHIHPYTDGNGRTARAVGNLQLIQAGYPPIIIKKVERERYYDCLSESDEGNLGPFLELIFDRCESSLIGIEQATKAVATGPVLTIRERQFKQLEIWNTAVHLLGQMVDLEVSRAMEQVGGSSSVRLFESNFSLEDYLELCQKRPVPRSWAFQVRLTIPGLRPFEALAWVGPRTPPMFHKMGHQGGPSVFWSVLNPDGFPRWVQDYEHSLFGHEITSRSGNGDAWTVYVGSSTYVECTTGDLAAKISDSLLNAVAVAD
ncbi:MAG: Fic family protein [Fimbriimonadaceae bacterium]|nr:Fic family protein [Fimbriimonadaceae bacterium]